MTEICGHAGAPSTVRRKENIAMSVRLAAIDRLSHIRIGVFAVALVAAFCLGSGSANAEFVLQSSFGSEHLSNPIGVAVDQSDGRVYVGNLLSVGNAAFDHTGQLLAPPSPFPNPPSEPEFYSGVAVNPIDHDVYAVDGATQSVETFDPATGAKLSEFQVPGSANLFGFLTVVQIAADTSGNVYVPNGPADEVQVFNPSGGAPVGVVGAVVGTGSHELLAPSGVAVEPDGDIWVADTGHGRLEKFDASGNFLGEIPSPGVSAVAVDGQGDVFASASRQGEGSTAVTEFNEAGLQIQRFGADTLVPTPVSEIGALAYDSSEEKLYVADAGNNEIRVFVPAPTVVTLAASDVSETAAELHGTVDPLGKGISGCQFEFGKTAGSYEHTMPCSESPGEIGSGNGPEAVHADVAGLAPSTVYHVRLTAEDVKGRTAHGPDLVFATEGAPGIDEERAEPKVHTATISAIVNPFGLSTSCTVQYVSAGDFERSGYGQALDTPCEPPAGSGRTGVSVGAEVKGLSIGTEYHYRVIAANAAGAGTGPDRTFATFGIKQFSVEALSENGEPYTQAGGHPDRLVTTFSFRTSANRFGWGEEEGSQATPKDVHVSLPVGLIGSPTAVPTCPAYGLAHASCDGATQVGVMRLTTVRTAAKPVYESGIYNLAAPVGSAAQFGARFNGLGSAYINAGVRTGSDYGVDADSINITADEAVLSAKVILWGDPADPSHDSERKCPSGTTNEDGPCSSSFPDKPFLRVPTSCAGPLSASIDADTWEAPGEFVAATASMPPITGCGQVNFAPTVSADPTTKTADSPSGLDVDLHVPQAEYEHVGGTGQADLRDAVVTLPEGLTVDPSSANGLGACSVAQIELHGPEPASCPDAAKLGTVEIDSPLVAHPLDGYVYLAKPFENPFNSLLALYIGVYDPETGVVIKLAGEVQTDPNTGRLTSSFLQNPQLPFEDLKLDFFEGPRAPLRTPATCGSYEVTSQLTPWSAPESGPPATPSSKFAVSQAASGGSCPTSASQQPNSPSFEAGTVNPNGGSYSPFVLHLARADGTQEIGKIETTLPEGLLAKIAGVSECSNADIAKAEARNHPNEGAVEQASPSCPASSEVGVVKVGAGAGTQPFYATGHAYLAGPYEGAPLSLVVITPAVAGPFDLGDVVVRAALHVDPLSAQVTAVSDPIPHILQGIPLDVRSISLELDRPQFTVNPTNCGAKEIAGKATSLLGNLAPLKSPFAAANCASLAFKPQLKLSFTGQTKRTGDPAIKAVVTQPKGQNSNIAGATVILPKGMLIDQAHINDPCTRVQFNSTAVPGEGCPKGSVLGSAKVWTPLLEAPEEGKVYFRSNGGERQLPDMVVALQGKIPVQLVGFIDSVGKKGAEVRRVRSRFQSIPDAPVSRFELKLAGGKRGLIENSENLCTAGDRATYLVTGQNGKTYDSEPKVAVGCHGKKKGSGKKHGHGHKPGR
jgi:streptogramin lyase